MLLSLLLLVFTLPVYPDTTVENTEISFKTPKVITFQARLSDTAKGLINGRYEVIIRLYQQDSDTPVWSQSFPEYLFINGYLTLNLGSNPANPLNPELFRISNPKIGITLTEKGANVAESEALLPLYSVPYAILAHTAENALNMDWDNLRGTVPDVGSFPGQIITNQVPTGFITTAMVDKIDGSKIEGTLSAEIAKGSLKDEHINDAAAIQFGKLDIEKSDLVGLGLPAEMRSTESIEEIVVEKRFLRDVIDTTNIPDIIGKSLSLQADKDSEALSFEVKNQSNTIGSSGQLKFSADNDAVYGILSAKKIENDGILSLVTSKHDLSIVRDDQEKIRLTDTGVNVEDITISDGKISNATSLDLNTELTIGDNTITEGNLHGNWNFNSAVITEISSLSASELDVTSLTDGTARLSGGALNNVTEITLSEAGTIQFPDGTRMESAQSIQTIAGTDDLDLFVDKNNDDSGAINFFIGAAVENKSQTVPSAILDNNGNFGIGTPSPNARLDVVGSAKISQDLEVMGTAEITEDLTVQGSIVGTATNAEKLNDQTADYYTNADNISNGTLSFDRYSAYADLVSEARVSADSKLWTNANDAAGSGLDADLLDGQEGSFYQNATNIDAGTLNPDYYDAYADLAADGRLDYNSGTDLVTKAQITGLMGGVLPEYLRKDGSVALANNWDAGDFSITAKTLTADVAPGTAPLNITSPTLVSNLNSDLLDNKEGDFYQNADNLNAGTVSTDLYSAYSDLVAETKVAADSVIWTNANHGADSNLDADKLDGQEGIFYRSATNINAGTLSPAYYDAYADLTADNRLDNADATDLMTQAQITAARNTALQEYVNRDGSVALVDNWDAGDFSITAKTLTADVAPGTAPLNITSPTLVSNLNSDLLDNKEGDFYQNADNLNAGTVSTDLYSAYSDLVAETKIAADSQIWTDANDGAGTGLVADKLDGEEGSFYQSATNINAGTLNPAYYDAYADLTADNRLDNADATDLMTQAQISAARNTALQEYVNRDGSVALTNNWDMGAGVHTKTEEIRARTTAGLKLYNLTGTDGLFVGDNGRVGIKTTAPTSELEVAGAITATYFYGNGSQLTGIGSSGGVENVEDTVIKADTDANGTGAISFLTQNTSRMRVENNGDVSIGYASPATVAVTGTVDATNLKGNGSQITNLDAGSIDAGTVGTDYYSAYDDLLAENKIGAASTIWTSESDGVGTGLDADLLDGQEGSYYLDATNLTNTVSTDRYSAYGDLVAESKIGAASTIWTSESDGVGTGLDADKLDNIDSSQYLRSDTDDDFTGTNLNISNASRINFGAQTRQMINLWGEGYGLGVQNYTQYFRTGLLFAWYIGGLHSNTTWDPGTGGRVLMKLDSSGQLTANKFFDGNNPYYYVDPAGTTLLYNLEFGGGSRIHNNEQMYIDTDDNMYFRLNGAIKLHIHNGHAQFHSALRVSGTDWHGTHTYSFHNYNNQTGGPGPNVTEYSIWADGRIRTSELNIHSDARIKKNIKPHNNALNQIGQLNVVQYDYIDPSKNDGKHKIGFIAQALEKVLPDTVKTSPDYIPNIMEMATVGKWNPSDSSVVLEISKAYPFESTANIRVYYTGGEENESKFEGVATKIADNRIRIAGLPVQPDQVFVYGAEVSDFRTIDYDQVFSVGIRALQEVKIEKDFENYQMKKQIKEQHQTMVNIQSENEQLKTELAELRQAVLEIAKTKGIQYDAVSKLDSRQTHFLARFWAKVKALFSANITATDKPV